MGRYYSSHGGQGEITGVTMQKNSLGITAMICGMIFLWDWLEKRKMNSNAGQSVQQRDRFEGGILLVAMATAIYLLNLSQSKTSLICFIVTASIIGASYSSTFGARIGRFGIYVLGVTPVSYTHLTLPTKRIV